MKINKIKLTKGHGILSVWTSAFPNIGFNFRTDEIVNRNDLILKLKQRIIEETNKIQEENIRQAKFNQLKPLEGKDF